MAHSAYVVVRFFCGMCPICFQPVQLEYCTEFEQKHWHRECFDAYRLGKVSALDSEEYIRSLLKDLGLPA